MKSRIVIGTAQFGLNYGINNTTGKIPESQVKDILRFAYEVGISFLDTAYLYGDSEIVIGNVLSKREYIFNIVSKFPKCKKNETSKYLTDSLERLQIDNLYGFLYHNFETFLEDESTYEDLIMLKAKGKVKKIGFSLYYPKELEIILRKNLSFDLIQIPYNIIDRRFEGYFGELHSRNVEIHIRSVFLQGLIFMNPYNLPKNLKSFYDFLQVLQKYSQENNLLIDEIALIPVLSNQMIDKIVIGIDNLIQLKRLVEIEKGISEKKIVIFLDDMLKNIKIPEEMLIPSNWRN